MDNKEKDFCSYLVKKLSDAYFAETEKVAKYIKDEKYDRERIAFHFGKSEGVRVALKACGVTDVAINIAFSVVLDHEGVTPEQMDKMLKYITESEMGK